MRRTARTHTLRARTGRRGAIVSTLSDPVLTAQRVLYTSAEVHRAITNLLIDPGPRDRRVVIVAYLGEDAASYLPNPQSLEIVCAPEPGLTSPRAVRDLAARGADIRFADRLHMKVYWSSMRGCIITSANASR